MMAAAVIGPMVTLRHPPAKRNGCGVRWPVRYVPTGRDSGATLPPMKTTHYGAALAVLISACDPVDIATHSRDPEGSGSTGGDSSSSGESSAVAAESLPVASPTAALGLHPFPCTPVLELLHGGGEELFQCQCGGVQISPKACDCYVVNEACECDGEIVDPVACFVCAWDPYDPDDCFCGENLAPPEFCS